MIEARAAESAQDRDVVGPALYGCQYRQLRIRLLLLPRCAYHMASQTGKLLLGERERIEIADDNGRRVTETERRRSPAIGCDNHVRRSERLLDCPAWTQRASCENDDVHNLSSSLSELLFPISISSCAARENLQVLPLFRHKLFW